MRFLPAELFVIKIIAILFVLDAILIVSKGMGFDVVGYTGSALIGLSAVALGQVYRTIRQSEGISLATTATGLFILFSLVGSVFNYCLLPIQFPRIDPYLVYFDGLLGFHWPTVATWFAAQPISGTMLPLVYFSSLPQLVLVILLLGFSCQAEILHRFLITGVLGALLTFAIWTFFPAFGATSVYDLPADVLNRMPIAVGPSYGQELIRLSAEGTDYLSPKNALGLIGFPSFHTVMAMMSVFYTRQIKWAWPFIVALNVIMIPAIIVEGGHHLSDLFAGTFVFTCAYVAARRIVASLSSQLPQDKLVLA